MRKAFFALSLALVLLLPGCLDTAGKSSPVTLVVDVDSTSGEVVEARLADNSSDAANSAPATITWDFSETFSGAGGIATYWVDPGDGSDWIEVDPSDDNTISHDYTNHGVYKARAGANDTEGNTNTKDFTLFIDMEVRLSQTNTGSPRDFWFDTTPGSDVVETAKSFEIISSVENPTGLLLGSSVDVTWTLFDPSGTEVSTYTVTVGDGVTANWDYTHEAKPMRGGWMLQISLDGDENVNVDNYATIRQQ